MLLFSVLGERGKFMTRRELRENTFKLVFMNEFYDTDALKTAIDAYKELLSASEEEQAASDNQIAIYMDSAELKELPEKEKKRIVNRVSEVLSKLEEVDALINRFAKGWQTKRMAKVDLSLLRLAVFEMKFDDSVPAGVAINEAVELAKVYGGDTSASFINGILGKIARSDS